jgi:hypothetical protein
MKPKKNALAFVRLLAVAALLFCSRPLFAAALPKGADSANPTLAANDWSISFTPYGWLTFLSGGTTVKGRTADLDVDPIQVIDHLYRVPWFSYLEARKGSFSFYNDIIYADLALSGDGIHTVNKGLSGTVGASFGTHVMQFVAEAGGIYEVARWESGGGLGKPATASGFTALDVLAGARYWNQDLSLNFDLAGTLDSRGLILSGSRAIARAGVIQWVDPLIGFRLRRQFEPGRSLFLRGDIGGFGAGSQISWNALGVYNYEIMTGSAYTISAYIGYRALQVNYTEGWGRTRYEYDILQHGPVTGVTMKF